MAAFEYEALGPDGKTKRGVLEADSASQVRAILRDRNLAPMKARRAAEKKSGSLLMRSRSLPIKELSMVTRQLATLVSSGMPLEECLKAVGEQNDKKKLRGVLLSVRSKVMEGHSLANAMAQFPRAFDQQYRATVAAGEQSGKLDVVLSRLADYVEDQEATRRQLRMAATYPVCLTLVALGIVIFLLNNVVPRILDVFGSSGQALPAPTVALIAVTEFVQGYWLFALVGALALGGLLALWNRDERRRALTHRLYLRLPFIGNLMRGFNTARFASTLSMLSKSGVALVDAMTISSSVVTNLPIQRAVRQSCQMVTEGGSLSKALRETGYFEPMMIHMIASGESSGELDEMLGRTAQNQERNLKEIITTVMGLLEPLLLVVMGVVVMVIVLSVVLPLTQMNSML